MRRWRRRRYLAAGLILAAAVVVFLFAPIIPFSIEGPPRFGGITMTYESPSFAVFGCGVVDGLSFAAANTMRRTPIAATTAAYS